MLRKERRLNQKEQQMRQLTNPGCVFWSSFQSDDLGDRNRNTSFFSIPGVFVGLNSKVLSDSNSVGSPKSPLHCRVFSKFGSPFRSSLSPSNVHQRNWECDKVGLRIVYALDNDAKAAGEVLQSSTDGKNILFGAQTRGRTPDYENHTDSFKAARSLPKNYVIPPRTQIKSPLNKRISDVVFEIGETPFEAEPLGKFHSCSFDSCRSFLAVPDLSNSNFGSRAKFASQASPPPGGGGGPNLNKCSPRKLNPIYKNGPHESLSANEVELSEEYTCVISHGPTPKTTHIYGDCILKCDDNGFSTSIENENKKIESSLVGKSSGTSYPSGSFLRFCYACKKKLEEREDIYMYRGDQAFCSLNCRSHKIWIDEKLEEAMEDISETSLQLEDDEHKLFETSMFFVT
ncbi:hypothetical protein SLA2020_285630 [Shorea laevis]